MREAPGLLNRVTRVDKPARKESRSKGKLAVKTARVQALRLKIVRARETVAPTMGSPVREVRNRARLPKARTSLQMPARGEMPTS